MLIRRLSAFFPSPQRIPTEVAFGGDLPSFQLLGKEFGLDLIYTPLFSLVALDPVVATIEALR